MLQRKAPQSDSVNNYYASIHAILLTGMKVTPPVYTLHLYISSLLVRSDCHDNNIKKSHKYPSVLWYFAFGAASQYLDGFWKALEAAT